MLTAHAQISGAGITGANLQKNLAGQFNIGATNLKLSVINVHSSILRSLINVVATIPQLLSDPESAIISLFRPGDGARRRIDESASTIADRSHCRARPGRRGAH